MTNRRTFNRTQTDRATAIGFALVAAIAVASAAIATLAGVI